MDPLTAKVAAFVKEKGLISPDDGIVIGLSGGADSVCLLRVLCNLREEYGLSLYAVHINHGLRKEAVADEKFAKELAEGFGVPFSSYRCQVAQVAKDKGMTVEEAGRYARYDAFEKERKLRGADKIAVAHHKNDQAETVLFRICRGTGLKGLLGIPARRGNVIRPLMCLERKEIAIFLSDAGQEYREDATNGDTGYDRNRIRLNVVPEMERVNPGAVGHIAAMSEDLRQAYGWMLAETDRLYGKYVIEGEGYVRVSCSALRGIHEAAAGWVVRKMVYSLEKSLKDVSRRHIDSITELARMETGKRISLPYGLCAERQYDDLIISKGQAGGSGEGSFEYVLSKEDAAAGPVIIHADGAYLPDKGIYGEGIDIAVSVKKYERGIAGIPKNNCTKWLDYDKINGKISIRHPGGKDYFKLRDGGTKKLARHMIDRKIPRQYRGHILVAAEGSHVMAVLGGRTGADYYAGDGTDKVLEISIRQHEEGKAL